MISRANRILRTHQRALNNTIKRSLVNDPANKRGRGTFRRSSGERINLYPSLQSDLQNKIKKGRNTWTWKNLRPPVYQAQRPLNISRNFNQNAYRNELLWHGYNYEDASKAAANKAFAIMSGPSGVTMKSQNNWLQSLIGNEKSKPRPGEWNPTGTKNKKGRNIIQLNYR